MEVVDRFAFNELSERAKQYAVEYYANPEYEWWEDTVAFYKEEGPAKGFKIADVAFSGFSSQGDGASWSGLVDMSLWLRAKCAAAHGTDVVKYEALAALTEEGVYGKYATIARNGRYSHEQTMSVEWECEQGAEYDTGTLKTGVLAGASVELLQRMYEHELQEVAKDTLEDARDYAREIYKALEKEYNGFFEEDAFAETAEANEWVFDEDGRLV